MAAVQSRGPVSCDTSPESSNTYPSRALTIKQVAHLTSLSRAHIYALIARNLFPAPAKIGRKSIWSQYEIVAWLKARFAERNAVGCSAQRTPSSNRRRGGPQADGR